jgi:serine phosphatase RsbU (regulator of sigma subunit)/putative methionine-R-sulfoxide reductase with GAF domain
MLQDSALTDGLSWPSISFAILVASLLLSAIVLWRRFRSRRMLIKRVAELEALSAAGRAIVASVLDVNALCALVAEESGKVIGDATFQIGLFEDDSYTLLYWTVDGRRRETPRTFDLAGNPGVVGWVRDSKRPVLVRDLHKELDSLPAKPHYLSDEPPLSSIFIPLVSGEQTIGIVAAQSTQAGRFDEEDMRRLMILANQAAAAIAHAQLFEQAQKRAAHLELVRQIARQVNAVQDREDIFNQVVRLVPETFGHNPVLILEYEPQSQELVLKASSTPELSGEEYRMSVDQGLIGAAASTRQVIVCNDTANDDRFLAQLPGRPDTAVNSRAELAIPLLVNDEMLGVLDVQSPQPGVFASAELAALEALAAEVATAVDRARQLAQQREQAWITTAQLQVAAAIDASGDLDEMLGTVARLTSMLVGIPFCGFMLWDAELEIYQGVSLFGIARQMTDAFEGMRLPIGSWGPLDAVHVGKQMLTTDRRPPWIKGSAKSWKASDHSATLIPIVIREQSLGIMVVGLSTSLDQIGRSDSGSPSNQQMELLESIAAQTAQAIASMRLRIAQQEEAWVNTALLQVAEAVNSLNNLNEILDTIVRLIPMLVGVNSAMVLIWDEEKRTYHAGPSYGIDEMGRGLLAAQGIEEDEFLSVSSRSADFLTPTAIYYSLRLPPWLVKVLGTPTAHSFPLHARGKLVGLMLVGTSPDDVHFFSARRLSILNGIAHQAATALVNDQLYRESAERSRLEQELEVAREIQASLIPSGSPDIPKCSVASFWQAARQVSGDFYDFLHLPDGSWSIVIADVADKGVPAALFMALSRTIIRTVAFNRRDPAEVLMRANQIIDVESSSDLFVTVFNAVWDPKSGTLTYANGGHNPPMLINDEDECRLLTGKGMALGIVPQISVESKTIRFDRGDTILFYTDGVTEAMNEDYDEFGMERLRLVARSTKRMNATEIVQNITSAIGEHAGDTPQSDDITLVVIKRQDN